MKLSGGLRTIEDDGEEEDEGNTPRTTAPSHTADVVVHSGESAPHIKLQLATLVCMTQRTEGNFSEGTIM